MQPIESNAQSENDILIADQKTGRILVLDSNEDWNSRRAIKWEFSIKKQSAVFSRLFPRLNDAKRLDRDGRIFIVIAGNGGDGIALIDFETKKPIFYTRADGDPHTAEVLPGGYRAASLPRRGGVKLFPMDRNMSRAVSTIPHPGAHALLWDDDTSVLWSWGGAALKKIGFDRRGMKLIKTYRIPGGYGGGHDMTAFDGQLYVTHNGGISAFDVVSGTWKHVILDRRLRGIKGLSYNGIELIYTQSNERATGLRSRTNAVQSTTNADRVAKWGGWYKARWFEMDKL